MKTNEKRTDAAVDRRRVKGRGSMGKSIKGRKKSKKEPGDAAA